MNLEEYKRILHANLQVEASYNQTHAALEFIKYSFNKLIEVEEIEEIEEGYFEIVTPNGKEARLDGYSFQESDFTFVLLINSYSWSSDLTMISKEEVETLSSNLQEYIKLSINNYIIENSEISSFGYGVSTDLRYRLSGIRKFRLYIITDHVYEENLNSFKINSINNIDCEVNVWDLKRFYNIDLTNRPKETINVDLQTKFNYTIPCIQANLLKEVEYTAYLSIVPGRLLAELFVEYGSRLLEGNVRSFLSIKGNVNKKIRETILHEPYNFFTYNNGIAAIASNIELKLEKDGIYISKIYGLQIVNGGQTTATLATTLLSDKVDLKDVFVPMKLTVVNEEKAEKMIPNISRSSNSQNKVSEADFFSTHDFHYRIEELSRNVFAPAVNGNQYKTIWYYERSRGQYLQEQMKLSKTERDKFLLMYPKSQMFTKTDLAKYMNTYDCLPHVVSYGAQRNMRHFANKIDKEWEKTNTQFNEFYYKRLISLAIIYKETEKMIPKQAWYEQGYRANIVTYTLSKIFHQIKTDFPNMSLDFDRIWNDQKVYPTLYNEIVKLTKIVYKSITSPKREIENVTEWCKKPECWNIVSNIIYSFDRRFIDDLIPIKKVIESEKDAKKDRKLINDINVEIQVVELGSDYWNNLLIQAQNKKIINPLEVNLLNIAANMEYTGRVPNTKQAKQLMELREKLYSEGIAI